MLQFEKLVLSGFKSFVDTTELNIQPGLTGIVGPNGCGKSNLVEALRWVMGENSAKRMRGGEMDDVIFGGSEDRPSRNIAEVRLSIDNQDQSAPALFNGFDLLDVSRRIERDKGSKYRVNGKENRARDVQLLFADAGSGAQSNSLVGQGRIGALIGAKPVDRRVLLEEAAGIAGLYSRRHEAELRLKASETNLTRLDDLHESLHAQVRSLERQAKQAERYEALTQELNALEATVMHLDWQVSGELQATAKAKLREGQRDVSELARHLSTKERQSHATDQHLTKAREAAAVATAVAQRLKHQKDMLQADFRRQHEQRQSLEQQIAAFAENAKRERELAIEAAEALARLEREQEDLKEQSLNQDQAKGQILQNVASNMAALAEQQEKLDKLSAEKTRLDADHQATKRILLDLENQATRVDQQRAKTEAGQLSAQASLAKLNASAPEQALAPLEEAQEQDLQTQEILERKSQDLRTALDQALRQVREIETQQKSIQAERHGVKAALKASARSSGIASDLPSLLDQLEVEPGFEAALAAALGEDLDAPLMRQTEASERGWLCDAGSSRKEPLSLAPFDASLKGSRLSLYVQAPPALKRRLQSILVLEQEIHEANLSQRLAPGQRLVSRKGDLWRWDSYYESAVYKGAASLAETRLKQRNRMTALEEQLETLKPRAERAQSQLADIKEQEQDQAQALQHKRQDIKNREQEIKDLRLKLTQTANERAQLTALSQSAQTQLSDLSAQAEELTKRLTEHKELMLDAGTLEQAEQALTVQKHMLAEARAQLSKAEGERERMNYAQEQRLKRINAIHLELGNWQKKKNQAEIRAEDLNKKREQAIRKQEQVQNLPEQNQENLDKLDEQIAQAIQADKQASDDLASAETAQATANRETREIEKALSSARESLVRSEAQLEQAEERARDLATACKGRFGIAPNLLFPLTGATQSEDLPARAEADARRQRTAMRRESMGAINMRAAQEIEEIRSQLSSHERERTDVQAAVNTLRTAIEELNAEGRGKLLKAFEEVNQHFKSLFNRLFDGGTAELRLIDSSDPLQAGLQVLASPPGKRMQILSLLSGGEQALTAMSLLFAVFMSKPAPVCVLDEVDAPLDDENCIRFCDLIRDMAQETRTRFLIVTHNPHTMARVDRLFGVTMAEKGVSQLMSVNLRRAQALVDPTESR